VGNMPHDGNPALVDRYIVAFAGTSITEAINDIHGRFLEHSHSTEEGAKPVSLKHIIDKFDPDNYFHGNTIDDHFPQYLSRKGYNVYDSLNRNNAMLGDLMLGAKSSTPSVNAPVSGLTESSHKIVWASSTNGPALYYTGDIDDELQYSGGGDTTGKGKLGLLNKPLRVIRGVHLGEIGDGNVIRTNSFGGVGGIELVADGLEPSMHLTNNAGTARLWTEQIVAQEEVTAPVVTTPSVQLPAGLEMWRSYGISEAMWLEGDVDSGNIKPKRMALQHFGTPPNIIFNTLFNDFGDVLTYPGGPLVTRLGNDSGFPDINYAIFVWDITPDQDVSEIDLFVKTDMKVYLRAWATAAAFAGGTDLREMHFKIARRQVADGATVTGKPTGVIPPESASSGFVVSYSNPGFSDPTGIEFSVGDVDPRAKYTAMLAIQIADASTVIEFEYDFSLEGLNVAYIKSTI